MCGLHATKESLTESYQYVFLCHLHLTAISYNLCQIKFNGVNCILIYKLKVDDEEVDPVSVVSLFHFFVIVWIVSFNYRDSGPCFPFQLSNFVTLVKEKLQMLKKPNGTDKFPARTCKDLYMSYPDLPSGMT